MGRPQPPPGPPQPPESDKAVRALPSQIAKDRRGELTHALQEFGLETFPLTGYQPTRVRLGVVATEEQFREFTTVRLVEQGWWLQQDRKAKPLNDPSCWTKIDTRRLMQLFRPVEPVGGGRPLAAAAAVDVDLWNDLDGGVISTYTSNPVTTTVTSESQRDALVVAGPLADELPHPIDIVFTWVTQNDKKWQVDLTAVTEAAQGNPDVMPNALTNGRFQDSEELRYALRGVEAYLPWVNKVFVVSGNEPPGWLREGPRLQFVRHEEILPPAALPTFNSHAIESSLHNIPGLSEHFVYFNDDMFVCNPVPSQKFFGPAGQIVVYLSRKPIGLPEFPLSTAPAVAANNARAFLRQRYDITVDRTLLHVPYAMRRSAMAELWSADPDRLLTTQMAQVRSITDVPPVFLMQWAALLGGSASVGSAKYRTIDVGAPDAAALMDQLVSGKPLPDFLSLNQRDDGSQEGLAAMGATMKWVFPFPGEFELSADSLRS